MGRRNTTKRILHHNGQPLTFVREQGGTFDPVQSSTSGQTTVSVKTKGTLEAFTDEEIDGAEVQQQDIKVTVPVLDFEAADPTFVPRDGDFVIFEDETKFIIRRVRTLHANVAYSVQIRGG